MSWAHDNTEIPDRAKLNVGGSEMGATFEEQLSLAFAHKGDFPKEVAYTSGMDKWVAIANRSYQTTDEMDIIKATAKEVVSQLPSGTKIIDLGAANSKKFAPYVHEFLKQGKTCTYVPLDISLNGLVDQVDRAKAMFPSVKCVGIWGSFKQADAYYDQIPSARLFLSLGSIFYNAPDEMCKERCQEFVRHLTPSDRLIVGQDGPTGTHGALSHAAYNTKEYDAFFTRYLDSIQIHSGIKADAKEAWTYKSITDESMHYFEVVAQHDMTCTHFDNFLVKAGTTYKMFKSWKRGETDIHQITEKENLVIQTIGKAHNSGMRQYLIQTRK
ncbi:hypothetical protein B0J13DRAFT_444227 [Dactylonectria estremocensis]|uniref:Histidine-specific methyltransferase SAM-dependent domain-containing protein n=1 Tax=Dactylonectria estremocensis TaxID=1079267 RepID=A0A9P9EUW7_9HYPO|nr:hypothetical protein B0J13DRAFT_444227 [Dactylonectria estremocensis]